MSFWLCVRYLGIPSRFHKSDRKFYEAMNDMKYILNAITVSLLLCIGEKSTCSYLVANKNKLNDI